KFTVAWHYMFDGLCSKVIWDGGRRVYPGFTVGTAPLDYRPRRLRHARRDGKRDAREQKMQKRSLAIAILICMSSPVCMSSPAFAADPSGDWFVADRTAVIRIQPCGEAMCGTIAWTREAGTDDKNPDPTKRNQPIVGVTILMGMKPTGEQRWDGDVYNPEDGKTYVSHMILI